MTPSSKQDFLAFTDFTLDEHYEILDLAGRLKRGEGPIDPLRGRSLAMIFRKSSTRTRVSFEVGMTQLGGHALFISDQTSQMGRGESTHDTAKVLSRYVDAIMIRTFGHDEIVALAEYATVPVINGLTDLLHPCQILADLQTVQENFGRDLTGLRISWIGDGNNMANSWLNAAAVHGFELALACPEGFDPDSLILERAREATTVHLYRDPRQAAEGAHVVNTDVWASMGQEEEAAERALAFTGYHVDEGMMESAHDDAIFLHCLPAHRGEEVSAGVIDGPWSRVFDEAENRLHAQKALMLTLMGGAGQ
jgi:ornithine carbamoyltransferase